MFNPTFKFKGKMWKRWWLFHATDFQSLMYPCFTFCRILGIFPYKINASIFEVSKSRYISSTIVICITCVYGLAMFYETNILTISTDIAKKIQDICFSMLGCLIAIVSCVTSGPRMRLLQTVLEVSSKLSSKTYEKLSKLIHVKDIFGFLYLVAQTLVILSNYYKKHYIGLFCISVLERYIGLLVFLITMLYVDCVCVLKACFKKINDDLLNLRKLLINDKLHVPTVIYHEQRNPLLLEKLKILKKQHLMISDTVQMLNIIFNPQLLATIAIAFIEITFEIYFNMVKWQNGLSISLTKHLHHTFMMTYIAYQFIKIGLIVWACETGKNQAIKISTTVHDVLNSTCDKQIKNELRLFSLQILHRDNTFSARGFNVDATLVTAMVGTITTYLLILIQFLITSHHCD